MVDFNQKSEFDKKLEELGMPKKDTPFNIPSPAERVNNLIQSAPKKNNNTTGADIKPVKTQPKTETSSGSNATYLGTDLKATPTKSVDDFLSSSSKFFSAKDSFEVLLKKKGYENQIKPIDRSVKSKESEYQWRPKYEPKESESQPRPRFDAKQSEPEVERDSFGEWTGKQIMRGISNFNDDWASLLNWVLPTELIFKEKDPLVWLDNYYSGLKDYYTAEAERSSLSRGKGWNTAGDILSTAVEFIPDLAITLMSGGSRLVGKGLQAASLSSKVAGRGKLVKEIGEEIVDYVKKNPQNFMSYLKDVGDAYDSAKENGATDLEAAFSSAVKSAANIGLDAVNLPDGKYGELVDIIYDSAKDSVKGVINNGIDKLIFDEDKEMFSSDDEDAVFNLSDIGNNFFESISSSVVSKIIDSLPDSYKTEKEKAKQMNDEEFDEYIKNIIEKAN